MLAVFQMDDGVVEEEHSLCQSVRGRRERPPPPCWSAQASSSLRTNVDQRLRERVPLHSLHVYIVDGVPASQKEYLIFL